MTVSIQVCLECKHLIVTLRGGMPPYRKCCEACGEREGMWPDDSSHLETVCETETRQNDLLWINLWTKHAC